MTKRMVKAQLHDVDLSMLAIAATLRDRAALYRSRGHVQIAAELEHDAMLAEELSRPTIVTNSPTMGHES